MKLGQPEWYTFPYTIDDVSNLTFPLLGGYPCLM